MIKVYFNRFSNDEQLNNRLEKIQKEENGVIKSVRVVSENHFMEGMNDDYEGSFTVEIIYEVNK